MVIDHDFYMKLALEEAWKYQGLTYPNPAVGSLLLDQYGSVVSVEAHKKAGDPHAEVKTLKAAFLKLCTDSELTETLKNLTDSHTIHDFLTTHHNNLFSECTLYVTLEPCCHYGKTPPCAYLVAVLGIKTVMIGCMDPNHEAAGGKAYLEASGTRVISGVMAEACSELLEPFILWKKRQFVFFKHAQTLNGVIDGGYISSSETLRHVHALRDKIGLLVIGGNTVRVDRPTLDARLTGGRAPDILIYSRQNSFDLSIPLFGVAGRKVFISDTLEKIGEYDYVMIEGGSGMYEAAQGWIDWHLTLLSPVMRKGLIFSPEKAEKKEQILFSQKVGNDLLIWSK